MSSYKTRTTHYKEFTLKSGNQVEVKFNFKPSSIMEYKEYLQLEKDNKLIIGYLSDDSSCENPLEDWDGIGHIYSSNRNSRSQSEMRQALGLDSDWSPNLDRFEDIDAFERYVEEELKKETPNQDLIKFIQERIDYEAPEPNVKDALEAWEESYTIPHWLSEQVEGAKQTMWQEGRTAGTIGNKYAVSLDVYEHSGISYNVSGKGMQCSFDTARGGAVWVPDACCVDEINRRAPAYMTGKIIESNLQSKTIYTVRTWKSFGLFDDVVHQAFTSWGEAFKYLDGLPGGIYNQPLADAEQDAAKELAKQACETYTSWCNGDCYGVVVVTYDLEGKELESDECGGFIGSDHAYSSLESDYFPKE